MNEKELTQAEKDQLRAAIGTPPTAAITASRHRVARWFADTASLIQWDAIASPLGPLYLAAREGRLVVVNFGIDEAAFLAGLDPLARAKRDAEALAEIADQVRGYFIDPRRRFDVPLDLERLTPFQRSVLKVIRRIPAGSVGTYAWVAREIGKPGASRAVGQALGKNPVPIVIPCHRVIASDGSLGGYSGGGGLSSKRLLLQLEGALV